MTLSTSDFASGNDLPTSDFRPPTSDPPTPARLLDPAAIERKLALNTNNVDASRAHNRNIEWTYPRGGFGIQYRYG